MMLDEMYQAILTHEQTEPADAFNCLLDFIASKMQFKDSFSTPWIKMKTLLELERLFDVQILREEKWDWIGELHEFHDIGAIKGDYLISRKQATFRAESIMIHDEQGVAPLRILDTCAATGRGILTLSDKHKKAIFYGAEADIVAYRILILNMKIYDIPCSVINANHIEHDLRGHSPNWRFSNLWQPVKATKYHSEEDMDERRTLTEENTYRFV